MNLSSCSFVVIVKYVYAVFSSHINLTLVFTSSVSCNLTHFRFNGYVFPIKDV